MALHSSLMMAAPIPPMLLVFTPAELGQYAEIEHVLVQARPFLTPTVRIIRISETTYPEVVHSFRFTSLPAFVLLQQGLELWRFSGPVDSPDLIQQLGNQLDLIFQKNRLLPPL